MEMEYQLPKRITEAEFKRLAASITMKSGPLDRCRRVLVNGESVASVAQEAGVGEESIRKACRRIVGVLREELPVLNETLFLRAVARHPRMDKRNIELVRRVLVDQEMTAAVAEEAGITPPTLALKVRKIADSAIPEGWRFVQVVLPDDLADKVEQEAQQAALNMEWVEKK